MNFGAILLGIILIFAAVIGIIGVASHNDNPYVDSFGETQSNQTNSTQEIITNTTAPVAEFGAGGAILLAIIAVVVVILSISYAIWGRRNPYNTYRR